MIRKTDGDSAGKEIADFVVLLLPLRAGLVTTTPQRINRRIHATRSERLRQWSSAGKQVTQHRYGVGYIHRTVVVGSDGAPPVSKPAKPALFLTSGAVVTGTGHKAKISRDRFLPRTVLER